MNGQISPRAITTEDREDRLQRNLARAAVLADALEEMSAAVDSMAGQQQSEGRQKRPRQQILTQELRLRRRPQKKCQQQSTQWVG